MTTPAAESALMRLAALVEHRQQERPGGSYTVELFDGGHTVMSSKIIEEAYELVEAAGGEEPVDRQAITHEAADLVYHLLVLLTSVGVSWQFVERELMERFGTSGLAEKAGRS